ncbi:MAG: FG-GAP-like repeat-containing protein [Thermoanaerobaculia bacterium]
MRSLTRCAPIFVLAVLPLAAAGQLAPIGLSEVRGRWLANEDADPANDQFGWAFAAGDFNGDFVDDLATGRPFDDGPSGSGLANRGSVVVRYGHAGSGLLDGPGALVLSETPAESQANEYFGGALAAGDFNGDGIDDLAVAIPGNRPAARGAVRIYYGAVGGLQVAGSELLEESSAGEPQHLCDTSQFGWSLAAGDFDGDSFSDLAVGAFHGCENVQGELVSGGSVFVAHGKEDGLLPFFGYRISQNSFGFDPVEAGDEFGAAVAAGDFDADGYDDLAIGIPGENDHGAIQIVIGSEFGLLFAENAFWWPGALGELPESGDALGYALAAADFDGDGHDDLAIGTPFEDLDPGNVPQNVGKVDIAYGAPPPAWFDLGRTDRLSQGDIHGSSAHEGEFDSFGLALGAGDFDGDGRADLAIGSPGDDWSGSGHGAVTIVMGHPAGLGASSRHRLLATGWEGLPGDGAQLSQDSGKALGVGDFDGNGYADLAIGVPAFDSGGAVDAGGAAVLYGSLFADGFELGAGERWSNVGP